MRHRAKRQRMSPEAKIDRHLAALARRGVAGAKEILESISNLRRQNWRIEF